MNDSEERSAYNTCEGENANNADFAVKVGTRFCGKIGLFFSVHLERNHFKWSAFTGIPHI